MYLLKLDHLGGFTLVEFLTDHLPPYGILSHTWGPEEVSMEDVTNGTGRHKLGYEKIQFCLEAAKRDGLNYFWIDTCCINKSSSAQLQESINSMFRWYYDAACCYVYLQDVSVPTTDLRDRMSEQSFELEFRQSRWFTRGWTLQELLAPRTQVFYDAQRRLIGTKMSLAAELSAITGIDQHILEDRSLINTASVYKRLSWVRHRQTTRPEDLSYCMLGIFGVNMPLLYGEGHKAWGRLIELIARQPSDMLSFALELDNSESRNMFHVYLDIPEDRGAALTALFPRGAWTVKGNTALVLSKSVDQMSFDIQSYGRQIGSFTFAAVLLMNDSPSAWIAVTPAQKWPRGTTAKSPGPGRGNELIATVEEQIEMRRPDTRVFTVLVKMGGSDQNPERDVFFGNPALQKSKEDTARAHGRYRGYLRRGLRFLTGIR